MKSLVFIYLLCLTGPPLVLSEDATKAPLKDEQLMENHLTTKEISTMSNMESNDKELKTEPDLVFDKAFISRFENEAGLVDVSITDKPEEDTDLGCDTSTAELNIDISDCKRNTNDKKTEGTQEEIIANYSVNALSGTCDEYCSFGSTLTCSCGARCFLFKTCCREVEKQCPLPDGELKTMFENTKPGFKIAIPTCDKNLGVWVFDHCPNLKDDYLDSELGRCSKNNTNCKKIQQLRYAAYVTDISTGIIFRNYSIYRCLMKTGHQYHIWSPVLPMNGDESFTNINDLLELVQKKLADVFFQPTNGRSSYDFCGKASKVPTEFQILMDLNSKQYVQVKSGGFKGNAVPWTSLSCSIEALGKCSPKECHNLAIVVNNRCVFQTYVEFIISHSPTPLTLGEIENFATFISCSLRKFSAAVYRVDVSVSDDVQTAETKRLQNFNKNQKYFQLRVFCKTFVHPFQLNVEFLLRELLSAYVEDNGLASGLFLRWSNNALDENGTNGINNGSKKIATGPSTASLIHGSCSAYTSQSKKYQLSATQYFFSLASTPNRISGCLNRSSTEKKNNLAVLVVFSIMLLKRLRC